MDPAGGHHNDSPVRGRVVFRGAGDHHGGGCSEVFRLSRRLCLLLQLVVGCLLGSHIQLCHNSVCITSITTCSFFYRPSKS